MASQGRKRPYTPLSDSLSSLSSAGSTPKRQQRHLAAKSLTPSISSSPISTESAADSPGSELENVYTYKALSTEDTEEICFGMLESIQVMLKWRPKSIKNAAAHVAPLGVDGQFLRILPLIFYEGYCLVQTQECDPIGVLENRALKHLGSLSRRHSQTRFEAVIPESKWREYLDSVKSGGRMDNLITLEVDIFGPRYISDNVARVLGLGKFFLQRPSRRIIPPYENPQLLQLTYNVDSTTVDCILPLVRAGEQSQPEGRRLGDSMSLEPQMDLDQIFDEMRTQDFTGNVGVDHRVVTPLLRHQKAGLEFLTRRETLNIPDHRTLWESLASDTSLVGYRHAITGARSRTADDSPGGILADDMGLGKTITMIALILGSYNRAESHALQQTSEKPQSDGHTSVLFLKATLIVLPSELLLTNWVQEIEKHTLRGSVRYYKYHGKERHVNPLQFRDYDVVLTTYGTLAADIGKRRDTLVRICWYRIILDEAHIIRNWSTKQFAAVLAIPAHIRWCMTGTPIQNNIEDLGALVRFLRVPILEDVSIFRQHIGSEVQATKTAGRNSYPNLRLLLGSICLRRAQAILDFRSSTDIIRPRFNEAEEKGYRSLEVNCKEALSRAVSSRDPKAAHQNVLQQLLRLREFCNGLSPISESTPEAIFSQMQQESQQGGQQKGVLCEYCSTDIIALDACSGGSDITITECRRAVCGDSECSGQYYGELGQKNSSSRLCPFCKLEHRRDNLNGRAGHPETVNAPAEYPTKLLMAMDDIQGHIGQDKCIVFSLWKRTLDVMEQLLEKRNVKYVRVDGSVSTTKKRNSILDTFTEQDNVRVLLMTLGTGAVGLNNLSIASRIYLLEPQWNPSVEKQAIGRILRLGQKKEVKIIRFVMEHSIEKIVEKCQERKLTLASGGFNIAKVVQDHWLS